MTPMRFLRHLFTTRVRLRRLFGPPVLAAIEAAIREAEQSHAGEIRFAIEAALDLAELTRDLSPRERARQVFAQLGVWDTAGNNGVLIYLLLADRSVEIVADREIAAKVAPAEWEAICRQMQRSFREGQFGEGCVAGVRGAGALLARHFPGRHAAGGELPDQPVLL